MIFPSYPHHDQGSGLILASDWSPQLTHCHLIGLNFLVCEECCHSQDSSDTIGTPAFYLIKDEWMEGGSGLLIVAFPFLHSPQQSLEPSTISHLPTPNKLGEQRGFPIASCLLCIEE